MKSRGSMDCAEMYEYSVKMLQADPKRPQHEVINEYILLSKKRWDKLRTEVPSGLLPANSCIWIYDPENDTYFFI